MKKILTVILIVSTIASAFYLFISINLKQVSPELESIIKISESATISNLSFSYRTSPDGLVLINDHQNWPKDLISSISLFSKRDFEWFSKPGFLGEGPPPITISVFKNPDRLTSQVWADTNSMASNIELIDSPPVPAKMGGVDGIYYVVIGLYLFDTYVFTYGDEIYLVSGAYHEKGDEYYQNITDVMFTVNFK